MDDNQQSGSPNISDWMTFLGFLGSILLSAALPFFLGITAVHRFLPFGDLESWVHGWRAVIAILGIFVLWFFATYLTDHIADRMADKHSHPLLNELASDTLSMLLLLALMSTVFIDSRATLICSLATSALTALLGLTVNTIMDRNAKHKGQNETTRMQPPPTPDSH